MAYMPNFFYDSMITQSLCIGMQTILISMLAAFAAAQVHFQAPLYMAKNYRVLGSNPNCYNVIFKKNSSFAQQEDARKTASLIGVVKRNFDSVAKGMNWCGIGMVTALDTLLRNSVIDFIKQD
jgi:2-keto-3-deoxy-L-rhamnonate aldolase RhmA